MHQICFKNSQHEVYSFVAICPSPVTVATVAAALPHIKHPGQVLANLAGKGNLARAGRGVYALGPLEYRPRVDVSPTWTHASKGRRPRFGKFRQALDLTAIRQGEDVLLSMIQSADKPPLRVRISRSQARELRAMLVRAQV